MKLMIVLTLFSSVAVAQPWGTVQSGGQRAPIYDPSKGPLPMDRRYVMTREGAEAAAYEAQNRSVAQPAVPVPAAHPYALPKANQPAQVQAPRWFVNLPPDTENMMFAAATATSRDEQMAYDKARMLAERKMIETMASQIATETKSFRQDQGQAMVESFQQIIRKNARGELIGAQRVDSQTTFDGTFYKVYVLMRLPLGDANQLQTQRNQTRLQREAEIRARAAERSMERTEQREAENQRLQNQQLRQDLEPQSQAPGANTVPTAQGEVRLLDVDNEEYRRRRAETLQKPGAVIGHITVQ
jgi:hypothetical protein